MSRHNTINIMNTATACRNPKAIFNREKPINITKNVTAQNSYLVIIVTLLKFVTYGITKLAQSLNHQMIQGITAVIVN